MRKSTPKLRIIMRTDHDWKVPGKPAWIAFKSGVEYSVTKAQFDDMVPRYATEVTIDGD